MSPLTHDEQVDAAIAALRHEVRWLKIGWYLQFGLWALSFFGLLTIFNNAVQMLSNR